MSVRVMAMCWEIPLDSSTKLLLLALADHANDSGKSVYPGNARLARKVSLSIRQVQNLLGHLEAHGFVKREKYLRGGRGHAVEWSLNTDLLALTESMHSGSSFVGKGEPCFHKGCNLVPESMNSSSPQPSGIIINQTDSSSNEEEIGIRLPGESRSEMLQRLLSEIGKDVPGD